MTDWLTPTDWTTYPPSAHVVTRVELNEQIRNQLLYLYERRSPALAALLGSSLVLDTGVAVPTSILDGTSLLNAETNLYVVPVGKILIVTGLSVWNATTTSAFPVAVRIVPSGSGAGVEHSVFSETLALLEDLHTDTCWWAEAGDFVTGFALGAIADQVACRLDGYVLNAQPADQTLRMLDGVALSGSFTPLVTAAGTEIVYGLTCVNTSATPVRIDVAVVQSGGSVTNAKQVIGRDLEGTMVFDRRFILENGDTLQAKAATAGVVAARPSVVRINA